MNDSPSIKLILDNKDKSPKKLLKLRITYRRIPHTYSAHCKIRLSEKEFNNDKLKVTKEAKETASKALSIAKKVITDLGDDFTFSAFKKKYRESFGGGTNNESFQTFAEEYIRGLSKENTKGSYKTAVSWLEAFHPNTKISQIDNAFITDFVKFVIKKHKEKCGEEPSHNSIRIYLRNLKAIYNKAIKTFNLKDAKPFADIKTKSIRRQNYSISAEVLRRFVQYEPQNTKEEIGKDFFILTFALCGANCKDILSFKNKNIHDGTIVFNRNKTSDFGNEIILPLTTNAIEIFNKYGSIDPNKPNDYILPFLRQCTSDTSIRYKVSGVLKRINYGLSLISTALGISHITTYTARHTYGTLARNKGLSTEQIQKFLGHISSTTTENYLDSLSSEVIEKNKDIIENALK